MNNFNIKDFPYFIRIMDFSFIHKTRIKEICSDISSFDFRNVYVNCGVANIVIPNVICDHIKLLDKRSYVCIRSNHSSDEILHNPKISFSPNIIVRADVAHDKKDSTYPFVYICFKNINDYSKIKLYL